MPFLDAEQKAEKIMPNIGEHRRPILHLAWGKDKILWKLESVIFQGVPQNAKVWEPLEADISPAMCTE